MRVFVTSLNVPIGYTTPSFPSLFWPLGNDKPRYEALFLYFSIDIWKFTLYWSLLFFGGIYLGAGAIAVFNNLFNNYRHSVPILKLSMIGTVVILFSYIIAGLFKGFALGAVIGLLLSAIYRAGSLTMSTWIPFSWGVAQILYDICSSYLTSLIIL
jgi:hypothetical protein